MMDPIRLTPPDHSNDNFRKFFIKETAHMPAGYVSMSRYKLDNSFAFNVMDAKTGEKLYTATICVRNTTFPANEKYAYFKSWDQYEGVPEAFEEAGLIKITGLYHEYNDGSKAILGLISPRLKVNI